MLETADGQPPVKRDNTELDSFIDIAPWTTVSDPPFRASANFKVCSIIGEAEAGEKSMKACIGGLQ